MRWSAPDDRQPSRDPRLADQIDLVAVVNRTLEKAENIPTVHGGQAFSSLTDAVAATDIDVIVICTPPGGRAEAAIEALEAGKP